MEMERRRLLLRAAWLLALTAALAACKHISREGSGGGGDDGDGGY